MYSKRRTLYFITILITIFLGLLSRKISYIPAIIGDMLYAVMSYWMFRFIFPNTNQKVALLSAIMYCFVIELLQLVQIEPLISIRKHVYLRLIFGQGFLWSDLVAYVAGSIMAFGLDKLFTFKKQ